METSLKFLQTDYVELKAHKIARFIGITGHNDGAAMAEALRRHEFDTVLMSLNAAQSANPIAQRRRWNRSPLLSNPLCPSPRRKIWGSYR